MVGAMSLKVCLLALALGIVALVPVIYLSYNQDVVSSLPKLERPKLEPVKDPMNPVVADFQFDVEREKEFKPGVEFNLKSCKVIDGYRFHLFLEGGKQIYANLTTATKDEATPVVVELLNKTTSPRPTIILRRKSGDNWIVDFNLMVDGKRANLIEVLRDKGLVL